MCWTRKVRILEKQTVCGCNHDPELQNQQGNMFCFGLEEEINFNEDQERLERNIVLCRVIQISGSDAEDESLSDKGQYFTAPVINIDESNEGNMHSMSSLTE